MSTMPRNRWPMEGWAASIDWIEMPPMEWPRHDGVALCRGSGDGGEVVAEVADGEARAWLRGAVAPLVVRDDSAAGLDEAGGDRGPVMQVGGEAVSQDHRGAVAGDDRVDPCAVGALDRSLLAVDRVRLGRRRDHRWRPSGRSPGARRGRHRPTRRSCHRCRGRTSGDEMSRRRSPLRRTLCRYRQ